MEIPQKGQGQLWQRFKYTNKHKIMSSVEPNIYLLST